MPKPFSFQALNEKTGEVVTDERRLAATRCRALLVRCQHTAESIVSNIQQPSAAMPAMADLVTALCIHVSEGMAQDIEITAKMLGCTVVFVPTNRKVDA